LWSIIVPCLPHTLLRGHCRGQYIHSSAFVARFSSPR
jgi:hypothetical protein